MDELIGSWSQSMSAPMLDDGVIKYVAPKGHFRRVFKSIEREIGLNFRRIKKRKNFHKAEITCEVKDINDGYLGFASWDYSKPGKFYIQSDSKYGIYKSTIAHEIGHALGLAHPDHSRTDTIMSYGRDRSTMWYLQPVDYAAVSSVFGIDYVF